MHLVLGHTVRDEHFATTNAVAHDFEITNDLLCDNAVASLFSDGPGLVFVFDSRKHGSCGFGSTTSAAATRCAVLLSAGGPALLVLCCQCSRPSVGGHPLACVVSGLAAFLKQAFTFHRPDPVPCRWWGCDHQLDQVLGSERLVNQEHLLDEVTGSLLAGLHFWRVP